MSNTAIKVENLSKIYRLGEIGTGTISRDMERWFKTKVLKQEDPFLKIGETNDRANKGMSDIVYSLQDINFEINQGDAVGIIGRNGAGKSTLLKILSRVTTPTTGRINIKGRVASLLEVGTGFHPELTGRENIYLNGAILGMRKREIDRKLDEIIDFSGVERYIDTPVKRYSSGMYVRLAFAVAAHLESEILIVDEVLAVGDAEFQKKCLGKMGEVSKGEGRTVLFVSHNMESITKLCSKGIFLSEGFVSSFGSIDIISAKYLNYAIENSPLPLVIDSLMIKKFQTNYSNGFLFVSIHFSLDISIRDIRVGFKIFDNTERNLIRTLLTDFNHNVRDLEKGDYEVMTTVDLTGLAEGQVRVSPHFSIFGIKDFLVEDTISSLISINKPKNFNMCYPQEKTLSTLITSNQWSIQKLK
jgi:ABC-type polysaccharide/polyol phosphate transport system ATPase subunit